MSVSPGISFASHYQFYLGFSEFISMELFQGALLSVFPSLQTASSPLARLSHVFMLIWLATAPSFDSL